MPVSADKNKMASDSQTNFEFDDVTCLQVRPLPAHVNHNMLERHLYEVKSISGLYYTPGFLDDDEQAEAVKHIDANHWQYDLQRRVQHYGWRYDYKARTITSDMYLGPLPDWITRIAKRLYDETKLFDRIPEQVIVNEYEPGQGIALHADRDCFGEAVATISLYDDWEMKFRPVEGSADEDKFIMLQRGSALILTSEARFLWMHGIDKRKTERGEFGQRERRRRVSVTFRTVINAPAGKRSTEN